MRTMLWVGLAAALDLALTLAPARAQQEGGRGYLPRVSVARYFSAAGSSDSAMTARDDVDPLRPYGARASGAPVRRPYGYAEAPMPTAPPTYQTQTRNYFPGLRPGQGPNRNYVRPETLCVPGRRAFLGAMGLAPGLGFAYTPRTPAPGSRHR
jgi:hypothetical protein